MTILVAGVNGQVGWELARQACIQSQSLMGLTRSELDITNPGAVAGALQQYQPTIVVNTAAYTAVDQAESEPESAFAVNRDGAKNLAQACRDRAIPLIHLSTDYVFDGAKGAPYQPDDRTNPINVYGQSKLAGEDEIRATLDAHVIVRTSWVYGVHGSNFVKSILKAAKAGRTLRVVDDQWGCPTSARSIADFVLACCRHYEETGTLSWGTYHYVDNPLTTWFEFAREIVAQAAKLGDIEPQEVLPIPTSEYPTAARRPRSTVLSVARTDQLIKWRKHSWHEQLQLILEEISANPPNLDAQ